jgi:hypothetical protein
MSENSHARFLQLIAKARVEGLSSSERDQLSVHLGDCTFCSEHARQADRALRSLRTEAIPLPTDLAARTQFRVRLRAQELREHEPKRRLLWAICGMSWALGVASAPYVWQAFEWLGQRLGAPKLVWEIGFGLWWTVPAVIAAIVILLENAKQTKEVDWSAQEK